MSLEKQAKHVFCVEDPCDERWSVILHWKTIGVNFKDDDSTLDICPTLFSTQMSTNVNEEEEVDDILTNHDEEQLIKIE